MKGVQWRVDLKSDATQCCQMAKLDSLPSLDCGGLEGGSVRSVDQALGPFALLLALFAVVVVAVLGT